MNEKLQGILKHPATFPVGVSVAAFGLGAGLGYILKGRKKRHLHVVPDVFGHVEEVRETEDGIEVEATITDGPKSPAVKAFLERTRAAKEAAMAEAEASETEEAEVVLENQPVRHNVFAANGDEGWDYDEEVKHRTPEAPYILHKDEYFGEEKGYTQYALTYYEGDNIMTDQDSKPVYNHDQVVGPIRFGHGTGDPNVFFVRNEERRAEYEILRDEGLYSVEVLGLELEQNDRANELKHSDRFRNVE